MPVRLLKWIGLQCILALVAWFFSRPAIVLHYSADAQKPVAFLLNENDAITRGELAPGQTEKFFMPMFPASDSWTEVSLPFASRDGVNIKSPYSRVDIYIDSSTKIQRTDTRRGFFDRFRTDAAR
ncbi:hypothetical protein P3T18_000158 [Paraburkholderia sp. GAS199]